MDPAEVDRVKTPDAEEEDTDRLDMFDDPVRMYFQQMGQVALLTREQEVEISKRIEAAENEVRKIIYGLGFAGKEHMALAEKLLADPPRERFDRVVLDNKVDSRNAHLRVLRRVLARVRKLDQEVDRHYIAWREPRPQGRTPAVVAGVQTARTKNSRRPSRNSASNTRSSRKWRSSRKTSTTSCNTACGRSPTPSPSGNPARSSIWSRPSGRKSARSRNLCGCPLGIS